MRMTIRLMAAERNMAEPSIVSQGGVGLAESIDRDWSYFSDTLTKVRSEYKGPSVKNPQLPIDTSLAAGPPRQGPLERCTSGRYTSRRGRRPYL